MEVAMRATPLRPRESRGFRNRLPKRLRRINERCGDRGCEECPTIHLYSFVTENPARSPNLHSWSAGIEITLPADAVWAGSRLFERHSQCENSSVFNWGR